ncbi:sigma-70 family RNA polymerase sigma factor [Pelagicoccus sp. SDUM812003]|uniref:sigma-70 family RNA polymerase sigma factor n=1 Tax=Pelagicoccus sp. SDUM812003 TaxID=3041267 RepID=UPI00280DED8F|nr:sigma-70 family RNA polymerase sigma factor [Pelagicoccus sp. SDUM812003]MDQ8202001.1 sigma-70 family RNA polymerase sigma factor [Pelagicoccus sp. SDUM812003]
MNSDTESELIRRGQAGDRKAFDQLVRMHQDKVYGQALRMLKSETEAQDVAQLAWIKAWNKLDTFRQDSAFSTWLYRITTFTALDAIRKRDSRRESLADQEFLEHASQSEVSPVASAQQIRSLERKELHQRLLQAIEQLPEKLKTALKLRELEGLTYEEIAKKLNCKTGTVMSRLFNARKSIQKHLIDLLP